ncbi:MAG: ferrous iron transport protein B [Polyangiaceae bacterium]|nr:ferrous iron transport protein B [Polyangiaceae bacterium]MCW5791991.1 ferrous iron transport protein B [Polyangiaceae bacterium]
MTTPDDAPQDRADPEIVSQTDAEEGREARAEGASSGGRRAEVAILGNPNVGKSSLFNHLSGAQARVGNYPGVTVELSQARLTLAPGREAWLTDVPGAYSLSARSAEEQIALGVTLGLGERRAPDVVLLVVDAGQLARHLYLALQLLELRIPLVLAVNLVDEVEGDLPLGRLQAALGVRCVATNGRTGAGVAELKQALLATLDEAALAGVDDGALGAGAGSSTLAPLPTPKYPSELVAALGPIEAAIPDAWLATPHRLSAEDSQARRRALALWALTSIDDQDELQGIPEALRAACRQVLEREELPDVDLEVISARYAYLDALVQGLAAPEAAPLTQKLGLTDRVDRVLLHPLFGFLIFFGVMLLVFQSLFAWADPAIGLIESGISALQDWVKDVAPSGLLRDLVTEGVLGGVGNVVVFLPQILLLFLFVGLLEDSGYMARVAYLMDRVMRSLGLHGRAFVPMLSGFACAIPAVLATRTMERQRDRLLTMLVIPLMTCSARLPVYTLIIGALFPPSTVLGFLPVQGLLMVAMYLFAILMTLAAAAVLGRTVVKGRRVPLILELPPYRVPSFKALLRATLQRAGSFLKEAGGVILVCTLGLWVLLSFPRAGEPAPGESPEAHQAAALEQSYAGRVGKAIEPSIAPLGFDWKIGVGLIGAFGAREVFVSTMGLVYGVGEPEDEEAAPLREKIRSEMNREGKPTYTPLVGLSLLVFFAIACQCMSTLAVVKRETKGYRWPLFMFAYMTALAWVMSFIVYQGGRLLGFG